MYKKKKQTNVESYITNTECQISHVNNHCETRLADFNSTLCGLILLILFPQRAFGLDRVKATKKFRGQDYLAKHTVNSIAMIFPNRPVISRLNPPPPPPPPRAPPPPLGG